MPAFTDRVALITGAGSGLGRQIALTLASEGAAVAAVDLHAEPLAALAHDLKGKPVSWAVGDVTDRASLRGAVAQLQEQTGPIDLLVANAGIGRETSALTYDAEAFEDIVRVNLLGVSNSIDAVLHGMLRRRRGHLVAISSLASYRGLPRMAGYCASKAGVNALMDAFRVELKPFGIDVTTICPGWIRTNLTAQLDVPMPQLMDAAEAARLIIDAVRRGLPFYAFPSQSARRVRLLRWLPCSLSDWLMHRVLRSLAKPKGDRMT